MTSAKLPYVQSKQGSKLDLSSWMVRIIADKRYDSK